MGSQDFDLSGQSEYASGSDSTVVAEPTVIAKEPLVFDEIRPTRAIDALPYLELPSGIATKEAPIPVSSTFRESMDFKTQFADSPWTVTNLPLLEPPVVDAFSTNRWYGVNTQRGADDRFPATRMPA